MTVLVIAAGAVVLAYFAVLVGMSMDTERQRVSARYAAAERRELQEERFAAQQRRAQRSAPAGRSTR